MWFSCVRSHLGCCKCHVTSLKFDDVTTPMTTCATMEDNNGDEYIYIDLLDIYYFWNVYLVVDVSQVYVHLMT